MLLVVEVDVVILLHQVLVQHLMVVEVVKVIMIQYLLQLNVMDKRTPEVVEAEAEIT